jgi:hypothetical protein
MAVTELNAGPMRQYLIADGEINELIKTDAVERVQTKEALIEFYEEIRRCINRMKKENLLSQGQAKKAKEAMRETVKRDDNEIEIFKEIKEEIDIVKAQNDIIEQKGDYLDEFEIALLEKHDKLCMNSAVAFCMVELNCSETNARACIETALVKRESAKGNIKLKTSYKDLPERIIAESD